MDISELEFAWHQVADGTRRTISEHGYAAEIGQLDTGHWYCVTPPRSARRSRRISVWPRQYRAIEEAEAWLNVMWLTHQGRRCR